MIRLFFIFIILLASVWLGVQLNHDPGYILVSINSWTLETTLWVGVMALVVAFGLFYILLAILGKLGRSPGKITQWFRRKQSYKSRQRTRQGLIEFSEGYWSKALHNLIKALPNAETPLLNYLTAARAAQEMGDSKLRDKYLCEAQQSMPEAKVAVELTQAQLQLANHQYEQALATLRHLQDLAPQHPYVIKLLLNLYEEVRDWNHLINILPTAKKLHIIKEDAVDKLSVKAYTNRFKELQQNHQHSHIEIFMEQLPKPVRQDKQFILLYARYLWKQNQCEESEQLLRKTIQKQYDPELIDCYGTLYYHKKQLNFAESLLKKHPHCAHLHLCCGRLSKKLQLWGKARSYLEASIQQHPSAEAYFTLGALMENLQETNSAMLAYKDGLELLSEENHHLSEH